MAEVYDRFSNVAEGYARYRPQYPKSLYDFILSLVPERECAWDVGTGNGQVASVLSKEFREVIATDISEAQISQAIIAPNITYRVCPAHDSGIPESSVDLITAAQAVHWFYLEGFEKEVARVARQDALLAIWGYTLLEAEPTVDTLIRHLYSDILNGFWDPQRTKVDIRYRDLHFPFAEIACPSFTMEQLLNAQDVLGYLRTWSAVSKYKEAHGRDPVLEIEDALIRAFDGRNILCRTPLFLRAWRL
jgi:hypothetical protein